MARLLLAGDVMTGRGIDQILPCPLSPVLYEPWVKDARDYVALAERRSGPIPRQVAPDYLWGDALEWIDSHPPDLRILNLETAITTGTDPWPDKGIHYRMHPANLDALLRFAPDACTLANNHVLDWSTGGLLETLGVLAGAGVATAGAGRTLGQAEAPAILPAPDGRLLLFSLGTGSSGIPPEWVAGPARPGVNRVDLSDATIERLAQHCRALKRPGDLAVASIHWGGNWGWQVPPAHVRFAHALIDRAGIDLVHGHSSHHPLPVEVHRGRLILYGCGDLVNDYEGIGGYGEFRGELALLYLPTLSSDGTLQRLQMLPLRRRRFRLENASGEEAAWLAERLSRHGAAFGSSVTRKDRELVLQRLD